MKRILSFGAAMVFLFIYSIFAFAQAANPDVDFATKVLEFIRGYGGLSEMAKIGGYVLLLIAITKTSFLAPIWSKMPEVVKTLLAPVLGLIAGVISQGSSLTWASAFAFIAAGAGAVFLHEILDGVKNIPGIGSVYVQIIGLLEGLLGKPADPAA